MAVSIEVILREIQIKSLFTRNALIVFVFYSPKNISALEESGSRPRVGSLESRF